VQSGSHHSNQYILAIITILITASHTKVNNNHTYIHTYHIKQPRETTFLFQRLSIAHQQGNEVYLQNTMNSPLQLLHALYQFSCLWQHSLICKQDPSRRDRHNVMNDINFRSLSSAGIPASKEPTGLTRLDRKRPDGLPLVPWQGGKPVTWDITVVSTLAQSYLHASGHSAAGAAELAVFRK